MAEATIPVDLFNPGQVFACLGFLEAADLLLGEAAGGFDWSDPVDTRFRLRAADEINPVLEVLSFLAEAEVTSTAPAGSLQTTEKWNVSTRILEAGAPFPFPSPPSPATLPVVLSAEGKPPIQIDHWGDETRRDKVKFWAGVSGYPAAALTRDSLDLVRHRAVEAAPDPFALAAPQRSSFRFDWRRDYIPVTVGFSPNKHSALTMVGFPLVEILAAIGLSHARPERIDRLQYRYGVVAASGEGDVLCPLLLRAALGCAELPLPQRSFLMHLGWPGQEGQARCITEVKEETKQ